MKALANIQSLAESRLTLLLLQEQCMFSTTESRVSQHLTVSCLTSLSPNKKLAPDRWTRQWIRHCLDGCTLGSCCQLLSIQMEVSDKWCPQGWVFNNFAGTMDRETECTLASLLMILCGQPAEGKSWHPEAAEQA